MIFCKLHLFQTKIYKSIIDGKLIAQKAKKATTS